MSARNAITFKIQDRHFDLKIFPIMLLRQRSFGSVLFQRLFYVF